MTSFSLILGGVSCAFCGVEVSPSRAGGFHAPITETHSLKIRLPASHSNPAAFILPGGGPLRRSVEPTRTPMAALLRIFVLGPRTILNLVRPLSAGSSLCVAFIDHCREPFDRIANWFVVSPVPVLSLATVHAVNLTEDRKHEVPKKCGF